VKWALELEVTDLNTVPEAFRGEYVARDGKFRLNVNGVEDVTGLKSALESQKVANRDIKAALKSTGFPRPISPRLSTAGRL